jgi:hypothetical protein
VYIFEERAAELTLLGFYAKEDFPQQINLILCPLDRARNFNFSPTKAFRTLPFRISQ